MEKDQFVKICIPILGPGGGRKIMYGRLREQGAGGRWIVECQDGRDRFFWEGVLKRLSPLQVLALGMEWGDEGSKALSS